MTESAKKLEITLLNELVSLAILLCTMQVNAMVNSLMFYITAMSVLPITITHEQSSL
jgi:hypothetical protein